MKCIIQVIFSFFTVVVVSQNKFSKEISFVNDNDLYTSTENDKYYTNGMFLSYRYISKKENNVLEKKIYQWQVAHLMFTPYKAVVRDLFEHDRPFAAYLYGSFGTNNVYRNNSILKLSAQLGVLGSDAGGRELQDLIHDIYGFRSATGWNYQIKNALGLNFEATYIKGLTKNKTTQYDVNWSSNAKAGTVFTNISTGLYARIGLKPLQSLANSVTFNTNLNTGTNKYQREIESFVYIKPQISYALYDATVEGSFLNKNSRITRDIIPVRFHVEVGIKFTANRFNFGYIAHYHTDKVKDLIEKGGHFYGTLQFAYLLR